MTVVLTTSPGFGRHGRVPARIEAEGWTFLRAADAAEMEAHLPEADYLVVGLVPVTAEVLAKGPRLKGVLKHGVGVDNIDIPACTAAGLPVTNTPAANADAVAELAMGLMFAMARFIPQGHASVTSGGWDRRIGTQLGGKVLGIVGLGNIGKRLARLARGLGMEVLATDRVEDPAFARDCGVTYLPLEELLARADYVSLHVFGGAGNAALIDDRALARLKPGARLVNLARGEVVDLDAVARALESGQLGGVAIDAYVTEPPDVSHPVFAHPNAVFTPHSGADTLEALENVGLMVIEDIRTLIAGGRPARCLNAAELG
ncbi:hydroxyacid dehydrogenase [Rhodobacter sphaeroides]|jgi:Phosphoglycerate dehydrogenase and related dehydrogenases|uniref:D-isomer specific 2-hydroxyacid dehydrogenase, NAD binding subunit n=1 Tax=Cereibacter sphaeroides (strain ATCC 17023 / DSM 158 / JCM 6121 / CCUG 31486 / LMG 2827 / NBRC 12203 / NCIMB 8253 / ATH 2.4.1.) TaxID=272943 RepID=Q3IWS3_CERS4|nr:phosphoglycerate dehydrogenase [Cereibacter sphaeroides]ABA81011.1 D-isomer specific 2-hydroxyacid dehydrogenase, NAD binding subunit [Cereibacter sphaeroides 2.4.1]AMJ49328.1 hydroxyacid dehydrogenase [Cereibacter sphaeroides]ANS36036.1 hydroxyacid dehydrogenase [Cereibacter sphaeroides]ATN65101.1 hydroxyacid dehydrogenase [Cereibacter sphaeroides]AXC63305.1 hydroxyacid dehydrogenase [Cereibacter sphaeroides 2.4.1]